MIKYLNKFILIGAFLTSFILHFPHFNKDLVSIHVWRQTQTQSTTLSFYEEDMNILNPKRNNRGDSDGFFRMEFPLLQWFNALLFNLFGNSILITRILMFLISILAVLGFYYLLKWLFNENLLASFGAWFFTFSPSFFYHSFNPLPDNLALCIAIWGLAFYFKWRKNNRSSNLVFGGILLAFGTLCKLPFILFYIIPFVFVFKDFSQFNKRFFFTLLIFFSWFILPFAWYASVIPQWNGNPIVKGMLENSDSSSIIFDNLSHNLVSTLPELLLNYAATPLFILGLIFFMRRRAYKKPLFVPIFFFFLGLLAFLFFEINAIGKDHDYYLFPFYPLIFIAVAYGSFHFYKNSIGKYLVITILVIAPLTCFLRLKDRWDESSPGFNKDLLIYKQALQTVVPKNALVVAGNDNSNFIFFYYIDKKGWGFNGDNLTQEDLNSYINKGAKYLYSDSPKVIKVISPLLKNKIAQIGSISIYELKQ